MKASPSSPLGSLAPWHRGKRAFDRVLAALETLHLDSVAALAASERSVALGAGMTIGDVVEPLVLFAKADACYYSLSYLVTRWLRNDDVVGMYTTAVRACKRVVTKLSDSGISGRWESVIVPITGLLRDLVRLARARCEIVELYKRLQALQEAPDYDRLASDVHKLAARLASSCTHDAGQRLSASLESELAVLSNQFQAQHAITRHQLTHAVLHLVQAKTHLSSLTALLSASPQARLATVPRPHLFAWMQLMQVHLTGKFSVFFSHVLVSQAGKLGGGDPHAPLGHEAMKGVPAYESIAERFLQQSGAKQVLVLKHAAAMDAYPGLLGYDAPAVRAPGTPAPAALTRQWSDARLLDPAADMAGKVSGIEGWPALFSVPMLCEQPRYWPTMISVLSDHQGDLRESRRVSVYDHKLQTSFIVTNIDPYAYLIVVVPDRRQATDRSCADYLDLMTGMLRNLRVFHMLKPQS